MASKSAPVYAINKQLQVYDKSECCNASREMKWQYFPGEEKITTGLMKKHCPCHGIEYLGVDLSHFKTHDERLLALFQVAHFAIYYYRFYGR